MAKWPAGYIPEEDEESEESEGPQNDDWIHKAYYNQAGPNPAHNAPAKPGWASTFNDRRK